MWRGKATLLLWNDLKYSYVGPAVTDEFTAPKAYAAHGLPRRRPTPRMVFGP